MTVADDAPEGARILLKWLKSTGRTQTEAAGQLQIEPSVLNRLLRGQRRASLSEAVRIQDLAGVPVRAWL